MGDGAPLASMGGCGKLVYRRYANRGSKKSVHVLPDFSFAGYERGGVAIPMVPVVLTVSPGDGDDRAKIQAAIDEVSNLPKGPDGFRGAVLLKKGTYQIGDTLTIAASGVVLRGEGQGEGGTVLVATAAKQHTLIEVKGAGSGFGEVPGTRTAITSPYVPVGSRAFEVAAASSFAPGDRVIVQRRPNQAWIDDLGMNDLGKDDQGVTMKWTPSGFVVDHERTVVSVEGGALTVDVPMVDTIEEGYGGGEVYKAAVQGRVDHCGVENLRIDSKYASDTDEQHGWTAIRFARAEHSWARRVTAVHFGYSAVTFSERSTFNTAEDVAHRDPKSKVDGGRRYSFYVSDESVGNLFQRCYSNESRHSFVTGGKVTGPNVWLDCVAVDALSDDGPHHRWATGSMFDNVSSDELRVENRRDSGTGHGWSGAQTLFWNSKATTVVVDAPKAAMNWAIGVVGKQVEGSWAPEEPPGHWESKGQHVAPRSLYLQQLEDRLGPQAVEAVTLEAQRKGTIWAGLSAWAGQGNLSKYLTP